MDAHDIVGTLLEVKALKFNIKDPFTFASGIKSPVYMNCRALISDTEKRNIVSSGLADMVSKTDADLIAATASAGIPWGAWVADELEMPMVYVEGDGSIIGEIDEWQKAVVIEDLVSTGGSSINAVRSLRKVGLAVTDCVSIFSYGFESAKKAFADNDVRIQSLACFSDAVGTAESLGYLTSGESEHARIWLAEPNRWRT